VQKITEIGSSLLKSFKIKLVTFFETRCTVNRWGLSYTKTKTPVLKQSGQPASGAADSSSLWNRSSMLLSTSVSASRNTHFLYCVSRQQCSFVNVMPSSDLNSRCLRFAKKTTLPSENLREIRVNWEKLAKDLGTIRDKLLATIQGGPKIGNFCTPYNFTKPSFKLFQLSESKKSCNNTITIDPTTPQMCRYNTLW